jgi:hypothetical protein
MLMMAIIVMDLLAVLVRATMCPAGSYTSGGSCILCPRGTFTSSVGSTSCDGCASTLQDDGAAVCSAGPSEFHSESSFERNMT